MRELEGMSQFDRIAELVRRDQRIATVNTSPQPFPGSKRGERAKQLRFIANRRSRCTKPAHKARTFRQPPPWRC